MGLREKLLFWRQTANLQEGAIDEIVVSRDARVTITTENVGKRQFYHVTIEGVGEKRFSIDIDSETLWSLIAPAIKRGKW